MSAYPPSVVQRPDTVVRYVEVADAVSEIRAAWTLLEAAVGSLNGRRFLGVFDQGQGWYRACVERRDDPSTAESELPQMVIPGGPYARIRLRGTPPAVYDEIAPTYAHLESCGQRDDSRPSVESYRRLDEIDVLMPVTGSLTP
jgi:hypothetical protein